MTRLVEHIFYADIVLTDGTSVDARPSDAIAPPLVTDVPLLVDEAVLEATAEIDPDVSPRLPPTRPPTTAALPADEALKVRQSPVSTDGAPHVPLLEVARACSAARSSGNVSCTCGRRLPSLTSGVTCSLQAS